MDRVKVGFFSFTEITDPDAHAAYNEWHLYDHLPEQYRIPGIAGGERWVSTPACRAARTMSGAPLDPIQYMTLYLMAEPVAPTLDDFMALGSRLADLGRFFGPRASHLSGPFRAVSAAAAPRVRVSEEVLPWRPARGVYVTVDDVTDASHLDDHLAHLQVDVIPAGLAVPGVAGVWNFATDSEYAKRWPTGRRRISVWYLDDDPVAVAARLAPIVDRDHAAVRRIFSGPFKTIDPRDFAPGNSDS